MAIDNEYLTGNSAISPYLGKKFITLSVLKEVIISPGDCRIIFTVNRGEKKNSKLPHYGISNFKKKVIISPGYCRIIFTLNLNFPTMVIQISRRKLLNLLAYLH